MYRRNGRGGLQGWFTTSYHVPIRSVKCPALELQRRVGIMA